MTPGLYSSLDERRGSGQLDTNKLWVASEVVAALLENEESQPEEAPKPEPEPDPDEGAPESPQPKANPEDQ
jgi:hypothetical protein